MIFVNINSVHLYELSSVVDRHKKRWSTALNLDVRVISNKSYKSIAFELSNNLSNRFEDYNSIEFFDLIISLLKKFLDLFRELIVDIRDS